MAGTRVPPSRCRKDGLPGSREFQDGRIATRGKRHCALHGVADDAAVDPDAAVLGVDAEGQNVADDCAADRDLALEVKYALHVRTALGELHGERYRTAGAAELAAPVAGHVGAGTRLAAASGEDKGEQK